MKLIIIRGPSGSGKSTLARHLGGELGINWFEADHYFLTPDGYKFDSTRLGAAHKWCQDGVRLALANKHSKYTDVIVSNTTTTIRELNDYLKLASEASVEVVIIRTPSPWDFASLATRNQHNVPGDVIDRQLNRYMPHKDEVEWTDITIFTESSTPAAQ